MARRRSYATLTILFMGLLSIALFGAVIVYYSQQTPILRLRPELEQHYRVPGFEARFISGVTPWIEVIPPPGFPLPDEYARTRLACWALARYRALTELASDWYWEQDENGNFTKVSGPVLEMLGIRVGALDSEASDVRVEGWNEAERALLQERIAARQPFLDFVFSRANANGSRQQFRVSGEPMFNQFSRFIGYRGIGVELTAKN